MSINSFIPTVRALFAVAASLGLTILPAVAQEFPSKVVSIVVPMSAGGQADILARSLAQEMGKYLHQGVVVVNRDGAAGTLGVAAVKNAAPDGYTIGFGTQGPFTIQPQLRKSMQYEVDDFEFVCETNIGVLIVAVSPKSPFGSLKELIEAARRAPGTITLGSVGVGSGPHLIGEAIALESGVKFNHIPFRSIGDLNVQLIGGGIDLTVTTPALLASYKNVRALAVSGSAKLPSHPEVPLLKDLGYKRASVPGFMGVYAPKGIPAPASARLRQACAAASRSEPFITVSERLASPVHYAEGSVYGQSIRQDKNAMADLVRSLMIKPE